MTLYCTVCWGERFHTSSNLIHIGSVKYLWQLLILYSIQLADHIFQWNYNHDTRVCDKPTWRYASMWHNPLEDAPLCDTSDEIHCLVTYLNISSQEIHLICSVLIIKHSLNIPKTCHRSFTKPQAPMILIPLIKNTSLRFKGKRRLKTE